MTIQTEVMPADGRLPPPMPRAYPTVIDLVGSTPIVRLDRISRDVPGTILAKLEFMNPGGSNKDRIGLAMIEAAERDGKLRPAGRSSSRPPATPASGWRSRPRRRATGASS